MIANLAGVLGGRGVRIRVAWRNLGRHLSFELNSEKAERALVQAASLAEKTDRQEQRHEMPDARHFPCIVPRSFAYKSTRRRRNALAITETELNVMAALAIIGLSRIPKNGYNTPAAMGTPAKL